MGSLARAGSEARPGSERRRPAAGRRPVPSIGQNTVHYGRTDTFRAHVGRADTVTVDVHVMVRVTDLTVTVHRPREFGGRIIPKKNLLILISALHDCSR